MRIVCAVNRHVLLYRKDSDIDWKLNHLKLHAFLAGNNDLFRELHHMYCYRFVYLDQILYAKYEMGTFNPPAHSHFHLQMIGTAVIILVVVIGMDLRS